MCLVLLLGVDVLDVVVGVCAGPLMGVVSVIGLGDFLIAVLVGRGCLLCGG